MKNSLKSFRDLSDSFFFVYKTSNLNQSFIVLINFKILGVLEI